jgi:hypothetical protein
MKKSNVKTFTLHNSFFILLLSFFLCLLSVNPAIAADLSSDLLKQPATEITVNLGNTANELKFEPNHLELVA